MFKNENITPAQIMTDCHTQIRRYIREKEPGINHQFDPWHFVKNKEKANKCKSESIL